MGHGTSDRRRTTLALCLAIILLPAAPSVAHHSYAAYESGETMTLSGTVETFEWANPHVVLHILAQAKGGGEPADWNMVTSEPAIFRRFGWTRGSLVRGDRVLVVFNPMKDGSHHGRLHTVTVLDTGRVLKTKLSGS